MNNQWRIENVRNAYVLVNYARNRSYGVKLESPKAGMYTPDDRRWAVILIGLTWEEMKLLMADIGDRLDVDCPPANPLTQQEFPDEALEEELAVTVPLLEDVATLRVVEAVEG